MVSDLYISIFSRSTEYGTNICRNNPGLNSILNGADCTDAVRTMILLSVVPYILTFFVYWVGGFIFWLIACIFEKRMKCQPQKLMKNEEIFDILAYVGWQSLTVYPGFLLLVFGSMILFKLDPPFDLSIQGAKDIDLSLSLEHPSFKWIITQYVIFSLGAETWFFFVHKGLHHPKIYRHIHKIHHKYTSPIAWESLYFHPIESVLNFGVVAVGPVICKCHVLHLWMWNLIAISLVMLHHNGYDFQFHKVWLRDSKLSILGYRLADIDIFDNLGFGSMTKQHDIHHQKYNCNYGVIGIWDSIYGTLDMKEDDDKEKDE